MEQPDSDRIILRCHTTADRTDGLVLALDDGAELLVDGALALDLGLAAGSVVTPQHRSILADPGAFRAGLRIAERLLARRLRSTGEIGTALLAKGCPPLVIDAVLHRLHRLGSVDDARFAGAFIRDALRLKPRSRTSIEAALRRRGVAAEVIARALTDNYPDDQEFATALAIAGTRLRRAQPASPEARYRRLLAFLLRRGFTSDIAHRVCRRLLGDSGDAWPVELTDD